MKVLFTALHFGNYRNFESVIRDLAARGHRVHLLADDRESLGGQALVERLADEYPTITWGRTPSPAEEPWFRTAQKLRFALDYVRFLDPRYADAEKLRLRNIARTPRIVRWMTSGIGSAIIGPRATATALKAIERLMPRSAAIEAVMQEFAPDVVLLTSLTFSRSFAMDQVKAARGLGVPTAACIQSWDHLSSKALMHIQPDATIVWNDIQKREAIEMHGIPAERVVVTGAQCYDQWFGAQPGRARAAFCEGVGLDPSRPFVAYVCSAMSPLPDPIEPLFVKDWIAALRASDDPVLRNAGVLVRPHPERAREWEGVSLAGLDNVVVNGRNPIDADAKADYFDALYHSSAVVGLCTTVFLEAAIIGRPVLTLQLPAYRLHQDGMLHFRYLLTVEGGLLHTAPDLRSHVAQLAAAIANGDMREDRNRRFLTAFVRPYGLDAAATSRFADAVEAVARSGRRQPDTQLTGGSPIRRAVVARLAATAGRGVGAWLLMDSIEEERLHGEQERAVLKQIVVDERDARWEAERRSRAELMRSRQDTRESKARLQVWKERRQLVRRWRYAVGTSAPVARLKGSLRLLFGARHE
jgi:hypothetical protein